MLFNLGLLAGCRELDTRFSSRGYTTTISSYSSEDTESDRKRSLEEFYGPIAAIHKYGETSTPSLLLIAKQKEQ